MRFLSPFCPKQETPRGQEDSPQIILEYLLHPAEDYISLLPAPGLLFAGRLWLDSSGSFPPAGTPAPRIWNQKASARSALK